MSKKTSEARKRAEKEARQRQRQDRMKNPSGKSPYARKRHDGSKWVPGAPSATTVAAIERERRLSGPVTEAPYVRYRRNYSLW